MHFSILKYLGTHSVSPTRGPEAAPSIMCRAYPGKHASFSVSDTSDCATMRPGNRAGTWRLLDSTVPPSRVGVASSNSLVLVRDHSQRRSTGPSSTPPRQRVQTHPNSGTSVRGNKVTNTGDSSWFGWILLLVFTVCNVRMSSLFPCAYPPKILLLSPTFFLQTVEHMTRTGCAKPQGSTR